MSFKSPKGYDIELKVEYDGLERTQLENLKALILEYKDTCVADQSEVTIARGYEYGIQIKDGSKVVNQKPSRMSPEKRELAGNFLDKMLLAGTIEPSSSQYNSRFLLISKPDGSFRPVVDFGQINEICRPVSFVLPRVTDMLENLAGMKVFSLLDLKIGYHQVSLAPETRFYTSFQVEGRDKCQYTSRPFGFQSRISQVNGTDPLRLSI